jgi:signal transduction histidine kinase
MTTGPETFLQRVLTIGIVVAGALTVQPLGWSGKGLVVAGLLLVNSLLLASRHIGDQLISNDARLLLLGAGVITTAVLTGVADQGTTYLFAFYLAGHAGFRLDLVPATVLAVATSLLNGLAMLLTLAPGDSAVSLLGFATGASVLIGMSSRSRQQALASALAAAESAERATAAEARSAVLTERSRIAREVHDVLAHSLAGINMQLELADALLETGDLERVRQATGRAQSLVQESLKQAQWTVHALREDTLPLPETLTAMLESSGHHDRLVVTGTVRPVKAGPSQNLLRIAQESLTNAARHAPGAPLTVTLGYQPDLVTLRIVNEAPAQPAHPNPGSGMGLIGMRERVALLGGTLTTGPVSDGPGRGGWQVEAMVPA